MRRLISSLLLLGIVSWTGAEVAEACSCAPLTPLELLEHEDVVYAGVVVEVGDWDGGYRYAEFEATFNWKGEPLPTRTLLEALGPGVPVPVLPESWGGLKTRYLKVNP